MPKRLTSNLLTVSIFTIMSLLLFCGGFFYYSYESREIHSEKRRELCAIAQMKIDQIVQWRKEKVADAAVISRSPFLTRAIAQWLAQKNDVRLNAEIITRLELGVQQNFYENVILLSPDGTILFSTNPRDLTLPPPDFASVYAAVREKSITISDLYVGTGDRKVRYDINAPVISAPVTGKDGDVIAVIVFHFDPDRFLHPLLNTWPVPAKTAEIQLVRKDGDSVVFLNDLRYYKNDSTRLRLPLNRKNAPAIMAVTGYKGIFEGQDYRGVKVLSDIEPIPGTPWFLIAKIDQSEIYHDLLYRLRITAILLAILFGLMCAGIAFIYAFRRKEIYRKLFLKEKELRVQLEVFKTTLYSIGDGVITTDEAGHIIQMNGVAENLTGWKEAEAIGKPLAEVFYIINEQTRSKVENPAEKVIREGTVVGLANHTLLVSKDGREIPIADSGAPVKAPGGELFGVVLVFRDQSEEIAHTKALRESEIRYRTIYDNIPAGVAQVSLDFHFKSVNPAFCRMLGYTSEEMLRKQIKDITNPDIIDENLRRQTQLVHGEIDHYEMEKLFIRKDGRVVTGLMGTTLVRDADGKPLYTLGTVIDITEQRKIEEAAQRAQKLESIGVLAGGIAHDFNNLLGGIFGYIDLAQEETSNRQLSTYLSKALTTIDRARALTAQLLTFAKGGSPVRKAGHLFPFIQETAHFALSGSNVACRFEVPSDLWMCSFDKNQIGQVIDNLVINAQQAMPLGGEIVLMACNISMAEINPYSLSKGNYVKVSVKDHGTGISKDLLSRIFDPFFTTKSKGHGLGLATCYSIVKRHGGCIDVESEPDKGSTFHVYLPACTDAIVPDSEISVSSHKGSGIFLIMDDEECMRETIRDMLISLGYAVICTENGKDAVDNFIREYKVNHEITGMIFDLTIPGNMGGKEAVEKIRKYDTIVPIFVASGYADDPVMRNPAEYGFTSSICKPFRKSELVELLNKHLTEAKK